MMEVVVTTGAIRGAKLQSDCHHQQTNAKLFTGWMPFLSPNQQCQSTKGKRALKEDHMTNMGLLPLFNQSSLLFQ